ncbi:putative lipoprotein [Hydrogenimonas sp.]|nr:putative lipoprotein [Hydrogenimonas sp.]
MIRLLLCALLTLWVGGCALKKPSSPAVSENIAPFLKGAPPPLGEKEKSRLYADFLQKRYTPWLLNEVNATAETASWAVRHYGKKELYGENRLPLQKERWRRWIENADYSSLNSLKRRAVTVYPCSLRLFPTDRPIFYDPSLDGEGYPFDYNQNSAVKAFTPLIVSHMSRDGGWAFVQTPFALGWLKMRDIAFVTQEQTGRVMKMPMVTVLKEGAPIYDGKQNFLFYAKTATIFPLLGEEDGFYRILVPKKRERSLKLEESLLPISWAVRMPVSMSASNIGSIAKRLLGEPYGWGGVAMDRDCSAMTRDFFAPFGIWLPRNSKKQAEVGEVTELKGLPEKEKERLIIEKGVPFRTLLHLPGHIMLYVGSVGEKVYVMHNIWGVKMREDRRYIIGRAVISTLYLGKDLPDVDPEALLIRRVDSMNRVAP